jgi:hypothetical protein
MSSTHGNDHHGPFKLKNLTVAERESAREVIATLLDEADDLDAGGLGSRVVARIWRVQAEELRQMMLLEPERETSVIPCACCDRPADRIGVHGLAVCGLCAIRETCKILDGPAA